MSTVKDLPGEIFCEIFGYLCKTTIQECFYVCKSWYRPATMAYYSSKIVFRNNHKTTYENLIHIRVDGQRACQFVKTYELIGAEDGVLTNDMSPDELLNLMKLSISLKEIRVSYSASSVQYMKHMKSIPAEYLHHIRAINTVGDSLYVNTEADKELHRLIFENSVSPFKGISTYIMGSDVNFTKDSTFHTVRSLWEFAKLDNLTIKDGPMYNLWVPILHGCVHLKSLNYSSLSRDPFDPVVYPMEPQMCDRLQSLQLSISNLKQAEIDFLSHCTRPNVLKTFNLVLSQGYQAWSNSLDSGAVLRFLDHTRQAEYVHFLFVYTNITLPLTLKDHLFMYDVARSWKEEGYVAKLCINFLTGRKFRYAKERIEVDRKMKRVLCSVDYFGRTHPHYYRYRGSSLPPQKFVVNELDIYDSIEVAFISRDFFREQDVYSDRMIEICSAFLTPEQQKVTTYYMSSNYGKMPFRPFQY